MFRYLLPIFLFPLTCCDRPVEDPSAQIQLTSRERPAYDASAQIHPLIDPDKLATLGDRGANSRHRPQLGDPRTETVTEIDFLLIINGLHVQGDVFLTNSFAINRSIAKLDGDRRPTKLVQVE